MASGAWLRAEERARERGRPLPRRGSTAAVGIEAQAGLPHRIERLLAIERETERLLRRLETEYLEAVEESPQDAATFASGWRERVRRISFLEVNELVDEHNEWFPIEARLRWDLHLQDYRAPFGLPWRKQRIDDEWALERFPPELRHARSMVAQRVGGPVSHCAASGPQLPSASRPRT